MYNEILCRLGFTVNNYAELAKKIRQHSLRMTNRAGSSHIGSNLPIADILAVLYGGVMKIDPNQPDWEGRDRFILSKGHACAAVYAVLAEVGFFPIEDLDTFCQDGSVLLGHISHLVPGVEASTGSLGHGLSIGCGMAIALKGAGNRVFVLLGDGDLNEGSTWEAIMFAGHHKLDNLVAIVDYNQMQGLGISEEILEFDPLTNKLNSFGWATRDIDGHDTDRLALLLDRERSSPFCLVAHTVKGKGVRFMENRVEWHYKSPNDEELERALAELEGE